jgi:hypothetical protein
VKNGNGYTSPMQEGPYNPVIFAECIESNTQDNIEVTSDDKKITVHFFVEKGPVEVMFNSIENKPSLKLYQDARWNQRFFDGVLDCVILRPLMKKDYKVWVIIEKI